MGLPMLFFQFSLKMPKFPPTDRRMVFISIGTSSKVRMFSDLKDENIPTLQPPQLIDVEICLRSHENPSKNPFAAA